MLEEAIDSLIHPVKSRLLLEIGRGKETTARQLAQAFPDIPQATLYRYLNRMQKDGLILVVSENRVRGAMEKRYALSDALTSEGNRLLEEQGGKGYLLLFTRFMSGLLKEFQQYADREEIDLKQDGTGFTVCPVYVTSQELEQALMSIGKILEPLMNNEPAPGRKRHSIATIITPSKEIKE